MKLNREMLNNAVEQQIITAAQADSLINFLKTQPHQESGLNLTNVLYYFGGLLAIGAMTLFMNLGWEMFGAWGVFHLCIAYALVGLWLAYKFKHKHYATPAAMCATFVVCLTPLAIYAFQLAMGWWPLDASHYRDYHAYIRWHWLYMELGTLIVGLILVWIYRYPFMVMPIGVTLWYMSMDIASMLAEGSANFDLSSLVSTYFGLLVIIIAFWVDLRSESKQDYAFWLYLFGVMTFWGGISFSAYGIDYTKISYFLINLVLITIGVILLRRVFIVFGAIGCAAYLGYLSWRVFQDSMLFPFALTIIGIIIIYLGTVWQKNEPWITEKAHSILPDKLRVLLKTRWDAE